MLLGDFETAVFAGSKRRHGVPAPSAGDCGALARRIRSRLSAYPFYKFSRFILPYNAKWFFTEKSHRVSCFKPVRMALGGTVSSSAKY
ncbi:hypothetical protein LH991_00270 [Schleiferilactobacillus harbinensis]|nr:hypothetical protein LH991_00270 [Schleiferilactobacillus harbinensis]